jgi:hypothetical protein
MDITISNSTGGEFDMGTLLGFSALYLGIKMQSPTELWWVKTFNWLRE